jgi:Domain of unknown function (DUF1707)
VSELRIGTRERELAMGALDEHLREGRLDPTEYAERSAVASNARFRSEIDALFTDLPAPHPAFPGGQVTAGPTPAGGGSPSSSSWSSPPPTTEVRDDPPPDGLAHDDLAHDDRPRDDRPRDDLPELIAPLGARLGRNAGKLSALAPVIAIGLFVLTGFRFPQVFLLVPLAIALLGWLGHRHGG